MKKKPWTFGAETTDEMALQDLKDMIGCGLVPTIRKNIFVFYVKGIILLDNDSRNLTIRLFDNYVPRGSKFEIISIFCACPSFYSDIFMPF